MPVGSDKEVGSDFQLICGTNRDLQTDVVTGRFREDLLSRINLWTFKLPGLRERPEDIAPNLHYELDRFAERNNIHVTFNKEARRKFLAFSTSPDARWSANFRDLNGAVTRMATLASGGRIVTEIVDEEIARLKASWRKEDPRNIIKIVEDILGPNEMEKLDRFEKVQLADVLNVCRTSKSISEAGRKIFAVSRKKKKTMNDADRLKKYLKKYELSWDQITR